MSVLHASSGQPGKIVRIAQGHGSQFVRAHRSNPGRWASAPTLPMAASTQRPFVGARAGARSPAPGVTCAAPRLGRRHTDGCGLVVRSWLSGSATSIGVCCGLQWATRVSLGWTLQGSLAGLRCTDGVRLGLCAVGCGALQHPSESAAVCGGRCRGVWPGGSWRPAYAGTPVDTATRPEAAPKCPPDTGGSRHVQSMSARGGCCGGVQAGQVRRRTGARLVGGCARDSLVPSPWSERDRDAPPAGLPDHVCPTESADRCPATSVRAVGNCHAQSMSARAGRHRGSGPV